jgi:hypothetical protein
MVGAWRGFLLANYSVLRFRSTRKFNLKIDYSNSECK